MQRNELTLVTDANTRNASEHQVIAKMSNMIQLAAVPRSALGDRSAMTSEMLQSAMTNAGVIGPLTIADQSGCGGSTRSLKKHIAPTNVWQVQDANTDPQSMTQYAGSLQTAAMGTPVPTQIALPVCEGDAFGQSRNFISNFYAAQLQQLEQMPGRTPQFNANVTCMPNTYGAWFQSEQELAQGICGAQQLAQQSACGQSW